MYCTRCIYNYRAEGGFCCSLKDIDTYDIRHCRDRKLQKDEDDDYWDDGGDEDRGDDEHDF